MALYDLIYSQQDEEAPIGGGEERVSVKEGKKVQFKNSSLEGEFSTKVEMATSSAPTSTSFWGGWDEIEERANNRITRVKKKPICALPWWETRPSCRRVPYTDEELQILKTLRMKRSCFRSSIRKRRYRFDKEEDSGDSLFWFVVSKKQEGTWKKRRKVNLSQKSSSSLPVSGEQKTQILPPNVRGARALFTEQGMNEPAKISTRCKAPHLHYSRLPQGRHCASMKRWQKGYYYVPEAAPKRLHWHPGQTDPLGSRYGCLTDMTRDLLISASTHAGVIARNSSDFVHWSLMLPVAARLIVSGGCDATGDKEAHPTGMDPRSLVARALRILHLGSKQVRAFRRAHREGAKMIRRIEAGLDQIGVFDFSYGEDAEEGVAGCLEMWRVRYRWVSTRSLDAWREDFDCLGEGDSSDDEDRDDMELIHSPLEGGAKTFVTKKKILTARDILRGKRYASVSHHALIPVETLRLTIAFFLSSFGACRMVSEDELDDNGIDHNENQEDFGLEWDEQWGAGRRQRRNARRRMEIGGIVSAVGRYIRSCLRGSHTLASFIDKQHHEEKTNWPYALLVSTEQSFTASFGISHVDRGGSTVSGVDDDDDDDCGSFAGDDSNTTLNKAQEIAADLAEAGTERVYDKNLRGFSEIHLTTGVAMMAAALPERAAIVLAGSCSRDAYHGNSNQENGNGNILPRRTPYELLHDALVAYATKPALSEDRHTDTDFGYMEPCFEGGGHDVGGNRNNEEDEPVAENVAEQFEKAAIIFEAYCVEGGHNIEIHGEPDDDRPSGGNEAPNLEAHAWHLAALVGAALLRSGVPIANRIDGAVASAPARRPRMIYDSSLRGAYRTVRDRAAESLRRLINVANRSMSSCLRPSEAHRFVASFLEWRQASYLLCNNGDLTDCLMLRRSHAFHSLRWALDESGSGGGHSVASRVTERLFAQGDINADAHLSVLANVIESNPANRNAWRDLVNALGAVARRNEKACSRPKCSECKFLNPGLIVDHDELDRRKSGGWWGDGRTAWWGRMFFHSLPSVQVRNKVTHNPTHRNGSKNNILAISRRLRTILHDWSEFGLMPAVDESKNGNANLTIKDCVTLSSDLSSPDWLTCQGDQGEEWDVEEERKSESAEGKSNSSSSNLDTMFPITTRDILSRPQDSSPLKLPRERTAVSKNSYIGDVCEVVAMKVIVSCHLLGVSCPFVLSAVRWLFRIATCCTAAVGVVSFEECDAFSSLCWIMKHGLNVVSVLEHFGEKPDIFSSENKSPGHNRCRGNKFRSFKPI